MNNKTLLTFLGLVTFCILESKAQLYPNRYVDDVFTTVTETNSIQFSTGVPEPNPGGGVYEGITGYPVNAEEYNTNPVDLKMDIFQPSGDTLSKRPVIVICFGGGFVAGERDYWSMRLLAQDLAKKGYVTATIDYRLGMNMFDADLATRAVYRGVQDGRSAVRFFRANAATYNIDPDQIYIGGHSSGGFIGLHNIFMDKDSERPASTREWIQTTGFWPFTTDYDLPDLGCLDCVGDNQSYSGAANAYFSLAGALGFLSYMETASDPSGSLFHDENDGTVPYNSGEPFSDISVFVIGSDLPIVHGSNQIYQRAVDINNPLIFYSYDDRDHGVHENGTSALYTDIVPGISGWFNYWQLKPYNYNIEGKTAICPETIHQTYTANGNMGTYFDWEVLGGTIDLVDPSSNTVAITWDPQASVHTIMVTPYDCHLSRGDLISMSVELFEEGDNIWMGGTDSWMIDSQWSRGHSPLICENIIIPQEAGAIDVTINAGEISSMRSLLVREDVTVHIPLGAELQIHGGGNVDIRGIINVDGILSIDNIENVLTPSIDCHGTLTISSTGDVFTQN